MGTRTAAQQRHDAKEKYDAYLATCPSRQLLKTLSDKWVVLTMSALADGSRRYAQIARTVAGASPKMLTQTLRTLERDGLVERTVVASVPVSVSYALTPLGESLNGVVAGLKRWAETHIDQVRAAQSVFDARP